MTPFDNSIILTLKMSSCPSVVSDLRIISLSQSFYADDKYKNVLYDEFLIFLIHVHTSKDHKKNFFLLSHKKC